MNIRQNSVVLSISLFLLSGFLIFCSDDNKGINPNNITKPSVETNAISEITRSSAISGGTVTSDGGDTILACGVCWSESALPLLNDTHTNDMPSGSNDFLSSMDGLEYNTTYYVRAYATNRGGTSYGKVRIFTTLDSAYTVRDLDGNEYDAVSIGTQVWMIENLRVTQYRNGDNIPIETDNNAWINLAGGACCFYDNFIYYKSVYGCLYNWHAVNDPRGLAPDGWHIPTQAEWEKLINHLGGYAEAGGKLKEEALLHWSAPNTGATNESGFTALPAGVRVLYDGTFSGLEYRTTFWSLTEDQADNSAVQVYSLHTSNTNIENHILYKLVGSSVRCVKD